MLLTMHVSHTHDQAGQSLLILTLLQFNIISQGKGISGSKNLIYIIWAFNCKGKNSWLRP